MSHKIVRITDTEFETDDGKVHPMIFELDEVPTIEKFQAIYDEWLQVFREKELLEKNESEIS